MPIGKVWIYRLLFVFVCVCVCVCMVTDVCACLVKPLLRYGLFSTFKDGGRPPSWICYTPVWTTREEYLMASVTVQNLVGTVQ